MSATPTTHFRLYGLDWPRSEFTPITATLDMIRGHGRPSGWDHSHGHPKMDMFTLYQDLETLLWPEDDHHDWSDLLLKTMIEQRYTTAMGPKNSGKTRGMAKFSLIEYWVAPEKTLILMSSTGLQGAELRVWGDVKDCFMQARKQWPDAPGNPVDSFHGLFTDSLDENSDVRDIRKGIICIAVYDSEDKWKGMSNWVGMKQKRMRIFADELQFYPAAYLSTLANLDKGNFKFVGCGNPIPNGKSLDRMSEPVDGWDSLGDITTTTTWKNRWDGITINFVGPDSPAIRFPGQFQYLQTQEDIDRIVKRFGMDSEEYWNQAKGVRPPDVSLYRVMSRDLALKFHAMDDVVWRNEDTIKGYAIDAGYGGDRCVGGMFEFGKDIDGLTVLKLGKPVNIPVRIYPKSVPIEQRKLAEDQIAEFVRADCERLGIQSANVFHDATGRGSLGSAFARLWRHDTNPVEFGGAPTERPVMDNITVYDEKLKRKRPMRCDEYYSKRVTEYWFGVRHITESGQLRGLTDEVLGELCSRQWERVRGDKKEIERKEDCKDRLGYSPDLGDWAAICCEGARRLGFTITTFQAPVDHDQPPDDYWKRELQRRSKKIRSSYTLTTAKQLTYA